MSERTLRRAPIAQADPNESGSIEVRLQVENPGVDGQLPDVVSRLRQRIRGSGVPARLNTRCLSFLLPRSEKVCDW